MVVLNNKNMKYKHLIAIIISATLFSCDAPKQPVVIKSKQYKLCVTAVNGTGWSESCATIYCDSVNMTTTKIADCFIDGTKVHVEANNHISINSNIPAYEY